MINAIMLQFSGFTSHKQMVKFWKKFEDFQDKPLVKLAKMA